MRVLLINPPTVNAVSSEVPSWVKRDTGVFPPLGLLYLAAAAAEYTDHEINLFDCVAEGNDYSGLDRIITSISPHLVGITAHTHNLIDVLNVASLVKAHDSSALVCIGGPHTEVFPHETVQFEECDFVLQGEAEMSFSQLLGAIKSGSGFDDIAGLFYRGGESGAMNQPGEICTNLDGLPFPRRECLDPGLYHYALGQQSSFTTMATSRGCPYSCTFCASGRKVPRARSPENVVDEIEVCLHLGLREIHLIDDTFNVSMERVVRICEEIIRRKLSVTWSCRPRAQGFTREIMRLMRRAGCVRIQIGVETGSEEGLKELKKGVTLTDIEKTVGYGRDAGIATMAYFLIGCPHEKSAKDILETVKFAIALDPGYCLFNILTPYPGTPIYEEGVARGLFKDNIWKDFALNPSKDFIVPVWDEYLSRKELSNLLELAYRKFYLRPRVIWRDLKQLRSMKQITRRLNSGLAMLSSRGRSKRQ